jgi:hypothetical protein
MLGVVCRPAAAHQALDLGVEAPGIRNFLGAGIGVVRDCMGSDNYTVGMAHTARLQLGSSERWQ